MASGLGRALSIFGAGMVQNSREKEARDLQARQEAEEKRRYELERARLATKDEEARRLQRFLNALRLREELGPGEVSEPVGMELSPFGLAEGAMSAGKIRPGQDSYTMDQGGFRIKPNRGEVMAEEEHVWKGEDAKRAGTRFEREGALFQNAQDDRTSMLTQLGQLSPEDRTRANSLRLLNFDPTSMTDEEKMKLGFTQQMSLLRAGQQNPNNTDDVMLKFLALVGPQQGPGGIMLPPTNPEMYAKLLQLVGSRLGQNLAPATAPSCPPGRTYNAVTKTCADIPGFAAEPQGQSMGDWLGNFLKGGTIQNPLLKRFSR